MLNKILRAMRLLALIPFLCGTASAEKQEDYAVRVGLSAWIATGDNSWQTSFTVDDPALGTLAGASRLEWDDLESDIYVMEAEVRLSKLFRITGRYGFGGIDNGSSTDSDWATVPRIGVYNLLISESMSDTDGDTALYDIALHCALAPLFGEAQWSPDVDVFVGYQYYEDELNMRNGVQTAFAGDALYEPFPEQLDSDFTFQWEGIRMGARLSCPLTPHLDVSLSMALIAAAEYKGEGYWNLRSDLLQSSPNFVQSADSGTGFEWSMDVSYRPWRYAGLMVGYRVFEWEAEDGRNVIYAADGSAEAINLDEVDSSRAGVMGGVFAQW